MENDNFQPIDKLSTKDKKILNQEMINLKLKLNESIYLNEIKTKQNKMKLINDKKD